MAPDTADIEITHGDRMIYPESGATKRDVVEYYRRVTDRIMTHLRDRPLEMPGPPPAPVRTRVARLTAVAMSGAAAAVAGLRLGGCRR